VVADGKYLTRDGIKDPKTIFEREVPENKWIEQHLTGGKPCGEYWLTAEYTFRSEFCSDDGLVLAGDAFGFLDPVFSSGLMLALKSGVAAGDAVHQALIDGDTSSSRFADYGAMMSEGIENMRKLVYAFYDPTISFRTVTDKYPEMNGILTDCLSGDVNRDFSDLFKAFAEFTSIPEPLPFGMPAPGRSSMIAA
jgi:flavin-dependent dehydrogenase